mgnify:CR=1 FL=1
MPDVYHPADNKQVKTSIPRGGKSLEGGSGLVTYICRGPQHLPIRTGRRLKIIWQRCRSYLSFLVPLLWHRLGLRRILRAHFDRYDIDFPAPPAKTGLDLPPPRAEELAIPEHPLAAHPGETTSLYEGYLRRNAGHKTTRLSGIIGLSEARVRYPTGVHGSRAGLVLKAYPSASVLDNPKYALAQAMLPLAPVRSRHAQGILLYTCWAHNFFHWTLDILPRLELIAQAPALQDMPLIMFEGAPGFVKQSLALAAPEREVLWLPAGTHRVETMAVPTNPSTFNVVSGRALRYLRDSYHPALQQALPADFTSAKRIYISRADAAVRRIANEAEIEARLAALGFQSVVMSGLSLAEQAEIFARAECIVSAHGAALVNLAFCAPDTRVVEIFQQGHKSRSYYTISGLLGLRYGFLIGQKAGADTAVEADRLIRLLEQMGIAAPG